MLTTAPTELRSAKPSLLMRLGVFVVKRAPAIFPREASEVPGFLHNRKPPKPAPMPAAYERRFQVERTVIEGQDCVTLHPLSGPGAKHILYFNGGGFVLPAVKQHWQMLAAMVDQTGASVTAALYDLVPEHPAANADRLADAVFARICEQWSPDDVIACGDSAGGHLALSLALRCIREGRPGPGRLALFAPWLDVTMQDDAARAVEPHDFMLKIDALRALGKVWAEDRDPGGPVCSPLYASDAELAQLPPVRMWVGQHDIFVIDNRTFVYRLRDNGIDAKLYEYAGAPHVFMALVMTREAKDVFGLVDEFIAD
jgi:acetyl esterase/lipase